MRRILCGCLIVMLMGCGGTRAQERGMTKAEFIKIDGGALSDRVDRAFRQFKSAKQGDSLWLAWHFPARTGVGIGPFAGMTYYDDGIRLERKENPAGAAVFLLTEASGAQPVFTRVKTLDLTEPYVFEKRPVYWLGEVDAAQSLSFLDAAIRNAKENQELVRGALRAIGAHDSASAISLLKEHALRETTPTTQAAAIASLARIKTDQAADVLIELYDRGANDPFKEEVIRGLGRSESRKAGDKLLAIARTDPNPKLRQQAVRRLSQPRGEGVWVN